MNNSTPNAVEVRKRLPQKATLCVVGLKHLGEGSSYSKSDFAASPNEVLPYHDGIDQGIGLVPPIGDRRG